MTFKEYEAKEQMKINGLGFSKRLSACFLAFMILWPLSSTTTSNALTFTQGKGNKRSMPFKTILLTENSGIRERENVVITNAKDWQELWDKIHQRVQPDLPKIDFEKKMVIASSYGQRNTGGYVIEIIHLFETDDHLEVCVKRTSSGGGAVTMAFTQSLHVIETHRVEKKIFFVDSRDHSECPQSDKETKVR